MSAFSWRCPWSDCPKDDIAARIQGSQNLAGLIRVKLDGTTVCALSRCQAPINIPASASKLLPPPSP